MLLFPPVKLHLAVNAVKFNSQRNFPLCFVSRASNNLEYVLHFKKTNLYRIHSIQLLLSRLTVQLARNLCIFTDMLNLRLFSMQY